MKKLEAEFEAIIRSVIDSCSDCDACRFFMNEDCLFFPELYRLVDEETENGQPACEDELKSLMELCTLCGLCPCPNIRNDEIRAKAALIRQNAMAISNRLLADVQQFGCTCGMVPGLINAILSNGSVNGIVRRITGINPERKLPRIPEENFFT